MELVTLHDGNGQKEVWSKIGFDGQFQCVLAGLQFDQSVAKHLSAFECNQRQGRFFTPMQIDLWCFAHIEQKLLGQDPQPYGIGITRDLNSGLATDIVSELIDASCPNDVVTTFFD